MRGKCVKIKQNYYYVFLHLQKFLSGQRLRSDRQTKDAFRTGWQAWGGATFFDEDTQKLVPHDMTRALNTHGDWVEKCSRPPIIRKLFNLIASYPDRLGPSDKFVNNSTELTCLEFIGYRIKYSTVLWLLELQITRGRKF